MVGGGMKKILFTFLVGIFSTNISAQTNLILNGSFVDTSNWTSSSGFATACSGGGGNGVNYQPCVGSNTLVFSYQPASVYQTVNISSASNLVLTLNHLAGGFADAYSVTLTTNNGQTAQISCPGSCSNNSINLLLSKTNLVGATTATVTISDTSGNLWDGNYGAQFANVLLFYPIAADTQQSLVNTSQVLQGTFTLQNSILVNSLSYDCNTFGENDVCISAGGRNTTVQAQGINNTSGLLIAAYKVHPEIRIGAYVDQNLSTQGPGVVKLDNSTPMTGIFTAWNEKADGTGVEVKLSAGLGQKSATVTRGVTGDSEPGSGTAKLNTFGYQATAKYGFTLQEDLIISPYFGMRYTQNKMGGYTEGTSSSVTAPLTYSALNTNATTALAGVGASYRVIPQVMTFASAGVETDTNTANGTYSATNTSIGTLTPVNFNANPVRTRPTATVGAYYDIEKNQRIGITGIYRQEAYQAVSTTTVMATYTVGL